MFLERCWALDIQKHLLFSLLFCSYIMHPLLRGLAARRLGQSHRKELRCKPCTLHPTSPFLSSISLFLARLPPPYMLPIQLSCSAYALLMRDCVEHGLVYTYQFSSRHSFRYFSLLSCKAGKKTCCRRDLFRAGSSGLVLCSRNG